MKKTVFGVLLFIVMFCAGNVSASWENVYNNVKEVYIGDVKIRDLASVSLKGLNKIDKNLNVGSGNNSVTLYYKGSVVDSVNVPENENDAKSWAEITDRFVAKAIERSEIAAEKDFMISDVMAKEMPKVLDSDSKFFESFDEARGVVVKNKRVFGARFDGNVLIVRILAFNKQTVQELKTAIAENSYAAAVLFDLRRCLGGMSSEAVEAADLFLDSGIITSIQGKDKTQEIYYTAKEDNIWKNKPVFIVVDGNTASAGEIFVAALKEQGIAKVIGTQTRGKGSMQKLIPLGTGSVLGVTNSFFKTPANNEIHGYGIKPDICTFEISDNYDVEKLLMKNHDDCYKESREDTLIELEIVRELLKKKVEFK